MIVTLDEAEALTVINESIRAVKELGVVGNGGYNVSINNLKAYQIGGAAEYAVNKFFGLKWRGFKLDKRHSPDAGGFEVRSTNQKRGRLILNQRDAVKKDRPFIHVMSLGNLKFKLMGWLYGYEVMTEENIFKRPQFVEKLWVVENYKLRDVGELNSLNVKVN